MSNLSELLPTGGGQNAVDFVASGTLSSGQTVALKANGTMTAVVETAAGAGSPSVFESASIQYSATTYDSTNSKVVIAYSDGGNSNYGTAVVGTVSETSISFGTPVVFESATSRYISATYDSTNSKVVIAYTDVEDSFRGKAVIGTVSGTSISFGAIAEFNSGITQFVSATYDSTNNKVVIAYMDESNSSYGTAIVGTVSGTSISFGSEVLFKSAYSAYVSATYDSANNRVVIAFQDGGNSDYSTAVVGTVSGTSISFGTAVVFNSATSTSNSATYDSANNKIVIAYRDAGNLNYGTAIVGTVSGTSISFGAEVVFENANSSFMSATFDSGSNKIVIAYADQGNSAHGTAVIGTVSGTSISFGSPSIFESANVNHISTTYDSSNNKVVINYMDGGNSNYGTSVVFQTTASSNSADFIGITAEAISDTATGAVNVYGGINEAQTGLTIGSDYYVQADGSLSTTASSVKVGQAISATTINMMDLT